MIMILHRYVVYRYYMYPCIRVVHVRFRTYSTYGMSCVLVRWTLLDFDGAEPGTTNEESENLRSWTRSPNIYRHNINTSIEKRVILSFYNVSCSLSDTWFADKRKNIFFTRPTNIFFHFWFDVFMIFDFFDPNWVPCVPKNHFSAPSKSNSAHFFLHVCTCTCMIYMYKSKKSNLVKSWRYPTCN